MRRATSSNNCSRNINTIIHAWVCKNQNKAKITIPQKCVYILYTHNSNRYIYEVQQGQRLVRLKSRENSKDRDLRFRNI